MWHRGVYISKQYFKFLIGLCWPHDLLVAEKCQTKSHLTEVCWKNASPESACGQRTTCFHGTLLWLQLCHFSLLFANQTFGRGCADGKGMIIDCCWGIGASRNFPLFFSSNQCDNVKNFKDQFLNHKFQARTTNSSCIHRTEIKGGGLQAISSSQFSVPAFGSTNFLDPRKLLRVLRKLILWAKPQNMSLCATCGLFTRRRLLTRQHWALSKGKPHSRSCKRLTKRNGDLGIHCTSRYELGVF